MNWWNPLNMAIGFISTYGITLLLHHWPPHMSFPADWMVMSGGSFVFDFAMNGPGDWFAWGCLLAFIVATIWWLWGSGKRKRASKAIGEKARLIRAALVRTMRERQRRRPVLSPQPI